MLITAVVLSIAPMLDEPHWAFVAPVRAPAPVVHDDAWCRDALDRFVLAKLEANELAPAPEADRKTLLRRVSLALTGLPPTPAETDAFVGDATSDAYERVVDRLLASPRFGERMASDWLDVARYADTFGYQSDWECDTWPWRDWVIASFNANQPYDAFVREQIAGDLMTDATREQRLATAFNRLHRMTNEGGSIDEEFRQEDVADRVATYGTAFLGLTVECARCHDHKFDPISQREYYSLGAFFSAIDEAGTYPYSFRATPRPALRLPTPEQETLYEQRTAELAAAESTLAAARAGLADGFDAWVKSQSSIAVPPPTRHFDLDGTIDGPTGKATLLDGDSGPAFDDVPAFARSDAYSLALWVRCPDTKARATVLHTSVFTIESDQQGYQLMLEDGRLAWQVIHQWPGSAAAIRTTDAFPLQRWVHVAVTYDGSSRADGLRIYLDGVLAATEVERDHLDGPATARPLRVGFRDRDIGFAGGAVDDLQVFDRELASVEVAELHHAGALDDAIARARGGEHVDGLIDYYERNVDVASRDALAALRIARAAHQGALESMREIMVMEQSPRARASYVQTRGAYDQPNKEQPVAQDRGIDAVLPFAADLPHDRAGLAAWTTDPRNPLFARVEVNRLWAVCFGRGLVTTQENFGKQGEAPSNRELLDALAVDFAETHYDRKAMLRRFVLSSTFRQSSNATAQKLERDAQNRWLSRGPSFRLSAETLRDQALAAAGLLVERVGGPSVKPWQPPGLWEDAGAAAQATYVPDTGEGAHRRSLYTYRKRTAPPPNMLLFDAGSREKCIARRQPTNTPLQALVLLNDPVFFECAQALAARVAAEVGDDPRARVEHAFASLAARAPRAAEVAALLDLYAECADDPLTLVCSTLLACDAVVTSR